MKRLVIIIVLSLIGTASATTFTTADCSFSAWQAAVNSAVDGDTIQGPVAGGSATWSSMLDTHKTLILDGRGCTVTLSGNDAIRMWATNTNFNPRITNWTFTGTNGQGAVSAEGGHPRFRIDHNTFTNLSVRAIEIDFQSDNNYTTYPTQTYGVIDHNTITNSNSTPAINIYGRNDRWFDDPNWGSANAMYVENNTITWTSGIVGPGNQDAIDGEMGSRQVFRFNEVTDGQVVCHDLGSTGQARSCRITERYNNNFHSDVVDSNAFAALSYRGGNGFDFNNSIPISSNGTHGWQRAISTQIFRLTNPGGAGVPQNFAIGAAAHYVCSSFHGWCSTGNKTCAFNSDCASNVCNFTTSPPTDAACGTGYIRIQNIDGPGPSPTGYPARDQIAVSKDDPTTRAQTAAGEPNYSWNNTDPLNGNAVITGTTAVDVLTDGSYIQANREYYQQVTSGCSGTQATGVCVGTLAARAANCTKGVGYWATDQGSWNQSGSGGQGQLYVCTATNTWTLYYTPYTYPHPLQGGSLPNAQAFGVIVIKGNVTF